MPKVIGFDAKTNKTVVCKNCGAVNEYVPNDERLLYQGRDISGVMCSTRGFNCGHCSKEIITYAD